MPYYVLRPARSPDPKLLLGALGTSIEFGSAELARSWARQHYGEEGWEIRQASNLLDALGGVVGIVIPPEARLSFESDRRT
jgi:hypothetical protein